MSGLFSRSVCFLAFFDSNPIAAAPPGLGGRIVGSINTAISHRGALVREGARLRLAAAVRHVGISPQLDLTPLSHPIIIPIIRLLNICPAGRLSVAPVFIVVDLRDDGPPTVAAPRRSLHEEPVPGPEPEPAEHARAEEARAAHRAEHPGAAAEAGPERLREEGVVEGVPAPAEQAGHRGAQPAESGERVAPAEGPVPPAPPPLHVYGGALQAGANPGGYERLGERGYLDLRGRRGGGRRWLLGDRRSCLPGTAL